jgi:hypothetical protein
MNSIINLATTDVNKSTVVVHKDGADFDVPLNNIKDIFTILMAPGILSNVPNYLPYTEYAGDLSSSGNGFQVSTFYNNLTTGLSFTYLTTGIYFFYDVGQPDFFAVNWLIHFEITNATVVTTTSGSDSRYEFRVKQSAETVNSQTYNGIVIEVYKFTRAVPEGVLFDIDFNHSKFLIRKYK